MADTLVYTLVCLNVMMSVGMQAGVVGMAMRQTKTQCRHNERYQDAQCQPCPSCPIGTGLLKACGYGHGAGLSCVRCPTGLYHSDMLDNRCIPCTDCSTLRRRLVYHCGTQANTVCGSCIDGHIDEFYLAYDRQADLPCTPCSSVPHHRQCASWREQNAPTTELAVVKHHDPLPYSVGTGCGVTVLLAVVGLLIIWWCKRPARSAGVEAQVVYHPGSVEYPTDAAAMDSTQGYKTHLEKPYPGADLSTGTDGQTHRSSLNLVGDAFLVEETRPLLLRSMSDPTTALMASLDPPGAALVSGNQPLAVRISAQSSTDIVSMTTETNSTTPELLHRLNRSVSITLSTTSTGHVGMSNLSTLTLEDHVDVDVPEIEGREVTLRICDDEDDSNSEHENEQVCEQPPRNVAEENSNAIRSMADAGPSRNAYTDAQPSGVGVAGSQTSCTDLPGEFSTDVPQPSAGRAAVREPVQTRVFGKDGIMGLDFSLQLQIHGAFNFEDGDLGAITIPKVPYDAPKLPFPIQETVQG